MSIDAVTLEVLWNRLQAIVDEADAVLGRTAFSGVVREAHDYVTVLLDPAGRSIAQCTYSIPSFIGTLPLTAQAVLKDFPAEQWQPGDVIITNDPWLGTGHLPDISMLSPVFHRGRLVAFAGNVAHMTDIGGAGMSAQARTVYEEGICIPPLKLMRAGQMNKEVLDLLRANVRVPEQVMGDIEAEISANQVMAARLVEFLEEYDLPDLELLTAEIFNRSEAAMRRAIAAMPDGEYPYRFQADGFDRPLTVEVKVKVKGDTIEVDYEGSSAQGPWGLNSVMNYTYAFSVYALKCLLDPEIPNNHGCFLPFRVKAPVGSFLNATRPAPVAARNIAGHLLPTALFSALAPVMPAQVMADAGGAPVWCISLNGMDDAGHPFSTVTFLSGGQGGRAGVDGHSTLHFPTNAANTPVEMLEVSAPILVEEKRFRVDSAGPGRYRGGFGQRVVLRAVGAHPITVSLISDKLICPPQGLLGGQPASPGLVRVEPERPFHPKGNFELWPGDRLVLEVPGGGGYGPPEERDPADVEADLRLGLITPEYARQWYGHIVGSVAP